MLRDEEDMEAEVESPEGTKIDININLLLSAQIFSKKKKKQF